jgi:hypothetical protein
MDLAIDKYNFNGKYEYRGASCKIRGNRGGE